MRVFQKTSCMVLYRLTPFFFSIARLPRVRNHHPMLSSKFPLDQRRGMCFRWSRLNQTYTSVIFSNRSRKRKKCLTCRKPKMVAELQGALKNPLKMVNVENDVFYQHEKSKLKIIQILGYTKIKNMTYME